MTAAASSSSYITPAKRKTRATDGDREIGQKVSNIGVGGSGVRVELGGIGVGSGRVTRRSTAQAQQVGQESGSTEIQPKGSRQVSSGNGRESDASTLLANKRQKITLSPKSRGPHTPIPVQPRVISMPPQSASQASSSSSPTKEPIPPLPVRRHLPYPIGLTFFRYPCHNPSQPPPPPGDPLNANWKPYDPYHPAHLEGLPASVRALSVLERAGRAGRLSRPGGRGEQTLGQAAATVPGGEGSKKKKRDESIPIDPSLISLPSLPNPSRAAIDSAALVAGNADIGLLAHASNQGGEGEFDFNTFFESATYETISALLSAGDDVGDTTTLAPGNDHLGYGGTSTARDT